MKGRVVVLEFPEDRPGAAALLVDGRLEDLLLDSHRSTELPHTGDICVAKVTRVLPKSAGAFCDTSFGSGFLRDAKGLASGARVLAQVTSLPEPGKAPTLSTRILVKGPRLILTPGAPGVNVSRRIGNETERDRLAAAVETALADQTPDRSYREDLGVIVRTEARGEDAGTLGRELFWLLSDFDAAHDSLKEKSELKYLGWGDAFHASRRNWLMPPPEEIVAGPRMDRYLRATDPALGPRNLWGDAHLLSLIRAEADPFADLGVHDQIDRLRGSEVEFPDVTMFIEATRALISVDVNTGADFSPAAGLKSNLAAARELPRQLRLRGLGGQIIVDFAPMPKQQRRTLEDALKMSFRADPVETSLVGWTRLGLYELQRKRERRPLSEVL